MASSQALQRWKQASPYARVVRINETSHSLPPETTRGAREGGSVPANMALGLSLAAVITWVAGTAADELFMVRAALAVAGMVLGVRVRRSARPETP